MNQRRGLTLIELLVLISIVGIMAAMLLPAVQQAREAARRMQCQHNLRQLGLGLHLFHDSHEVFPASGWTKAGPGNPGGKFIGWRALMLPYLEQKSLHRLFDFEFNWWEEPNATAGGVKVAVYRCPSAGTRVAVQSVIAKPPRPALTFSVPLAPADYEAMMGVRPVISPAVYNGQNRFSVMHRNSSVSMAGIVDGSSGTIMVVECAGRPSVYRGRRPDPRRQNDQGVSWIDSEGPFSLDGSSRDGSREGCGVANGCHHAMNKRNDNEPYSFHPGGGNFLFADAHVDFLAEETDIHTLAALCTRAAGEAPSLRAAGPAGR